MEYNTTMYLRGTVPTVENFHHLNPYDVIYYSHNST